MKIFLAYALLQAILPTYLAYTQTSRASDAFTTLRRRSHNVESTPRHVSVGQVYRRNVLERRALADDGNTSVSSSDINSTPSTPGRPLRRRAYLHRRGDYSMPQGRKPFNQLSRRSPVSLLGITDNLKYHHEDFDY
ncbi:hypothetical protein IWQ61_010423 [Dispira simplex]|nr:hypothetical protein IWQ61_010423 [Dispira simplex]